MKETLSQRELHMQLFFAELQYTALKKKYLLPQMWIKFNFQKCTYVSQILMGVVNTYP